MYQSNIVVERKKRQKRSIIFRKNYPDYVKNAHLKARYGITLEEKLELLNRQGGKCLICKKDIIKNKACVDHNHETGRVRGLLCDRCNHGLGNFKDNIELLQLAIEYLKLDF